LTCLGLVGTVGLDQRQRVPPAVRDEVCRRRPVVLAKVGSGGSVRGVLRPPLPGVRPAQPLLLLRLTRVRVRHDLRAQKGTENNK